MKRTMKHYGKISLNLLLTLMAVLLVVFVIPRILLFFMPFLIGWLIALMAHPMVTFIEKRLKVRRKAVSVVVIGGAVALVALLIYGIVYVLAKEIIGFSDSMPQMISSVKATIDKLEIILDKFFIKLPINPALDLNQIYDSFIITPFPKFVNTYF